MNAVCLRDESFPCLPKKAWLVSYNRIQEHGMDYIKIRFGDDIGAQEKDGTRRFAEMYHSVNPMFCMARSIWKPQVDICESGGEVMVRVALAGVDQDHMEVAISSHAMKITGNRLSGDVGSGRTYLQAEIRYGRFERLLALPCPVSTDNVQASFTHGLLTVHLVKSPSLED
jgi:HSP20 family protein